MIALEDRHHPLDMRLDDLPVLLHGGDDHVVHALFLDQFRPVVLVNGGQEPVEFLQSRRVRACDRKGDISDFVNDPPADGLVDCIPGGKETVDLRPAHPELGGDVDHRRLVVADAAKVLPRHFQDARAPRRDQFAFEPDDSWMSPELVNRICRVALDDHLQAVR
jgi:hypothetical protein